MPSFHNPPAGANAIELEAALAEYDRRRARGESPRLAELLLGLPGERIQAIEAALKRSRRDVDARMAIAALWSAEGLGSKDDPHSSRPEGASAVGDPREDSHEGSKSELPPDAAHASNGPTRDLSASHPPRDERGVACWVLERGGSVMVREQQEVQWLEVDDAEELPSAPVVVKVLSLAGIEDLRGEELGRLAALSEIHHLDLSSTALADDDLEFLPMSDTLRALYLRDLKNVSGTGLAHLQKFPHLLYFNCQGSPVEDAGFMHLKHVPQVKSLEAGDNPRLTDAGIRHLSPLADHLTALDLSRTGIGDETLRLLEQHAQLQWLYLSRSHISDAGLSYLPALQALRFLGLSETPITEVGLQYLKRMPWLRGITLLHMPYVTAEQAASLKAALPTTSLDYSPAAAS